MVSYILLLISVYVLALSIKFLQSTLRLLVGPIDTILQTFYYVVIMKHQNLDFLELYNSISSLNSWKRDVRLFLMAVCILYLPRTIMYAASFLPDKNAIINCLDLVSIVLATPRLFTPKIKETLFSHPLYSLYIVFVLWATLLSLKIFDYFNRDVARLVSGLENIPFGFSQSFMVDKISEMQEFSDWSIKFLSNVVVVTTILIISVTAMNFIASRDEQGRVTDIALFASVVIFTYSRAISMLT